MCWQCLERNRSPSPTPAGGPVAKPEVTRSGMGHPLSAPGNVVGPQRPIIMWHSPPATRYSDSEFGDSELGPPGMRDMLRNATFFGFFEILGNWFSMQVFIE